MSDDLQKKFDARLRMDFRFEAVIDPESGRKGIRWSLEPGRYELWKDAKEPMVFDTLDKFAKPLRLVEEMAIESLRHMPTGVGQRLGNSREYIAARREQLKLKLSENAKPDYMLNDSSEQFLATLADDIHGFVILSVDMVGSTVLSKTLDALTNARLVGLILGEIAQVVPFFHAHILKFTGDGVIAYIPPPSFLTANDNAIDCALTIRALFRDAISPSLVEFGYPSVNVRIGIESGEVVPVTIGHSSSKQQRDLVGRTLNLACKIQESCEPGEIRLGLVAYSNLHTMWKRGCRRIEDHPIGELKLSDGRPYEVYAVTVDGPVPEGLFTD